MTGGSPEKEADNDTQCIHCGRWYGKAGIIPHERNCPVADVDARMHEIVDSIAQVRLKHSNMDLEDVVEAQHGEA